jgi:hypothetical protein
MASMHRIALLLLAALPLPAQVSPRGPDAVIPVVASTGGLFGSFFKTELQMTNATEDRMAGWLYLRPHDATRRYDLEPHTTISFADVVSELGASGAGSLDILPPIFNSPSR